MRVHAGIDIGKSKLTVALSDPHLPPHAWPVTTIDLEEPDWWQHLRSLIPAAAIVTIEPTGTHYLSPIITALTGKNCQVWHVNTPTTGKIRSVHVSSAKSDRTDAQALALAATWIATGRTIKGAYPYTGEEDPTLTLRQLINTHMATVKTQTRALNRIQQLAHGLWPALAQSKTAYFRAVSVGAIMPDEVIALAARPDLKNVPGYEEPGARTALKRLAEKLPPGLPVPDLRDPILNLYQNITALELEIAALEAQISTAIEQPPFAEITRRWRTIPAYSDLAIAAVHVATHGRTLDYDRDSFKALLGAHPKRRQSGEHVIARKTKAGYRPAMKHMYTWTMRLLKEQNRPNAISDYYDRMTSPYRMQGAIGKLARVMFKVAHEPDGYRYP